MSVTVAVQMALALTGTEDGQVRVVAVGFIATKGALALSPKRSETVIGLDPGVTGGVVIAHEREPSLAMGQLEVPEPVRAITLAGPKLTVA